MVRVVTAPPQVTGPALEAFAAQVARTGAGALELRTDLHSEGEGVESAARHAPLWVSARGWPVPMRWRAAARWCDVPLRPGALELSLHEKTTVLSHHAAAPMSPDDAEALWRAAPLHACAGLKHVEPLGPPRSCGRLFETQRRLVRRFGAGRVTVLAHGALALAFRAALAERNAFDFVAAAPGWSAATGQRLLADAVRSGVPAAAGARLGIIGSDLVGSRSPRVHAQPFDRIELPPEADLDEVLGALVPLYRGLAVTNPFKQAAAAHVGSAFAAVNTLVRREGRFWGANTDVEGARAVLDALAPREVTVLGDGGAAFALRLAASELNRPLTVLRRRDAGARLRGAAVWTWPASLPPPEALDVDGVTIALICYGPAAWRLARALTLRGARVLRLGGRWFVAQARAQRELWSRP